LQDILDDGSYNPDRVHPLWMWWVLGAWAGLVQVEVAAQTQPPAAIIFALEVARRQGAQLLEHEPCEPYTVVVQKTIPAVYALQACYLACLFAGTRVGWKGRQSS
jgi:hypothetical protein